jgi:uncharacterized protein YcfJ
LGPLLSLKNILMFLQVLKAAYELAKVVGPKNARDTIRDQCSNCIVQHKLGGRKI